MLTFTQDTKVGAVTVLIALVSHKWVESIALSARCLKAGANWWCAHCYDICFFGVCHASVPLSRLCPFHAYSPSSTGCDPLAHISQKTS